MATTAQMHAEILWQDRPAEGRERHWSPTATVAFVLVFNIAAWSLIVGGVLAAF